jgi:hypothetical protein
MRMGFHHAWPVTVEHSAQARKRRTAGLLLNHIDDTVYQALLRTWADEPGRRLNYWLARAVRELGLSVAEAVRFTPRSAVQAGGTCIVVSKWAATDQRRIDLDTPEKAALVRDIVAYMRQTQRQRLCWPKGGSDGVESLEAAEVRFRESVRYQVGRIEKAGAKSPADPTPSADSTTDPEPNSLSITKETCDVE